MQCKTLLPALLIFICSCGGSSTQPPQPQQPTPMSGSWNAHMTSSGATSPRYIFGLSLSQSGTLFNGTFLSPTGTAAGDSCMDSSSLTSQGSVNGSSYAMILTASNGTKINVSGTISGASPTTITGTYSTVYGSGPMPPPPVVVPTPCQNDQGNFQMTKR